MSNLRFRKSLNLEVVEKFGLTLRSGPEGPFGLELSGATGQKLSASDWEAIVERYGRPSLLVRGGTFDAPASDEWRNALSANRSKLEKVIASVGRVELENHRASWVGTAWMIAPKIAVTNRHVAQVFTEVRGDGQFAIGSNSLGPQYQVFVNFGAEYLVPTVANRRARVKAVLYVSPERSDEPDLAFLELEGENLPPPIPLDTRWELPAGGATKTRIAVIGYPAYDDRNDHVDMGRIFEDIYEVKRLAPGEIDIANHAVFEHDASTLGGSSGSVVVDLESGAALGLHFAGEYLSANYAVRARLVSEKLLRATTTTLPSVYTPANITSFDGAAGEAPKNLERRKGYVAEFLGRGFEVALPGTSELPVAPLLNGGDTSGVLKYAHFSAVMNRDRRIALYTATNIDGNNAFGIKRSGSDKWYYDPRIAKEHQVGNELYASNELDRGHLTRRLDPAWGETRAAAAEGERDTFFWTNCSPQHAVFNQRIWLGLEDYVLENAVNEALKVSVFTGPQFRASDPVYRGVKLPRAFWKILVIAKKNSELSATAYMISQADLVSDIELAYGEYETYQVPVATIVKKTKLDFSHLVPFDPLKSEGALPRRIGRPEDMTL